MQADFFAAVAGDVGFDVEVPGRRFDAVLLDVDHSRATCCTRVTRRSTRRPACAAWPTCSAPRGSSRSGRTTRRTPTSPGR
ncbi:hypothetical protein NKG94_13970 [Micromonospora sp. M12]